jgi:hypothetical protein
VSRGERDRSVRPYCNTGIIARVVFYTIRIVLKATKRLHPPRISCSLKKAEESRGAIKRKGLMSASAVRRKKIGNV